MPPRLVSLACVVVGLAAGRGRKAPNGFVVSGRWPFSSGVDNSDWNMLAVTVYGDDGKTPVDWRLCLVPKSLVAIALHEMPQSRRGRICF